MLQRVMSQFSAEKFLCHSIETCRRGTRNPSVLCFRKFLEAKRLWINRGEYQNFPSKVFCLTVPKKAVGEPFNLSSISGIENIYASKGYVTIFHRKLFMSQGRKVL